MLTNIAYTPETTISANGLNLVYDAFGDPGRDPILLIAGLGSPLISWDEPFCQALAARGYWVIRYDQRDIGHATWFDEAGLPDLTPAIQAWLQGQPVSVTAAYTLHDMADDAAGLLDALGIPTAHIMGVSMGGMIAQIFTLRHPQRVRTLTILSSSTGDPALPLPQMEAINALLTPPPPGRDAYIDQDTATRHLLLGPIWPFDEAYARERAAENYDRGLHPAGTARHLTAIAAALGWKDNLHTIKAPTLVIHGDADPLLNIACGRDIAATIPHARLHILPGVGHMLPQPVWPETIDQIAAHAI